MINIASFDKEVKQLINIFNPTNIYQVKDNQEVNNNGTGSGTDIESWGPGVDLNYIEISRTFKEEDRLKLALSFNEYEEYVKDKAKYYKKYLIKTRGKMSMELYNSLDTIKDVYLRVELLRKVEKISNCERIVGRNGQEVVILHRCNDRGCPVCSYIKSQKVRYLLKKIMKENKKYRYSMLTLTVKDKDLYREKYQFYNKQVAKLIKKYQRKHKIYGSYRVQENKIRDGKYHLHYHILLASEYIKKSEISREWLKLTKDSFIVDIKEVNKTSEAINEICKYITKIQDWNSLIEDKDSLIAFHKYFIDIKGLRTMQGTGIFYNLNESEIEKEINQEERDRDRLDKNTYYWNTLKTFDNAVQYYNFVLSWIDNNLSNNDKQVEELREIVRNELINLNLKKEARENNRDSKKIYSIINFVVKCKKTGKSRLILPIETLISCYYKENEYRGMFWDKQQQYLGYDMFYH